MNNPLLPFSNQGYDVTNPDYVKANRQGRIHPEQKALFGSSIGRLFLRPKERKLSPLAIIVLVLFLGIFAVAKLLESNVKQEYIYLGIAILVLFVLVGIGYLIFRLVSRNKVTQELKDGSLRYGSGEVTFGRQGYEIEVKGKRLRLPLGFTGSISPGVEYRFYFLPESGTVLSVEQLSTMDDRRASENLTNILARANRFKLDVLDKNRKGRLALKQIPHLFGGIFVSALFIGVLLYFMLPRYRPYIEEQNWSDLSTAMIIFGLVVVGIIIYAVYLLFNSVLDLLRMRVLHVEGVGHPFKRTSTDSDGDTTVRHFYKIGDQKFSVTRKAYSALIQGLRYRAYYTPHRKKLVNIEALESPLSESVQKADLNDRFKNSPDIRVKKVNNF